MAFKLSILRKICRLDGLAQKFFESNQKIRLLRRKYFEKMRDKCISDIAGYSSLRRKNLCHSQTLYDIKAGSLGLSESELMQIYLDKVQAILPADGI